MTPPPLPAEFLRAPIAHRALHRIEDRRPENSRSAILSAIEAGYGIEIDIQRSSDNIAMVFHDDLLDRLTGHSGRIADQTAADLTQMTLLGSVETIPTLEDILALVGGRVPLLIELKDQDGGLGPDVGAMERAVADDLKGYAGPVAIMSFNPHSVAEMAQLMPHIPRGLTTESFPDWSWESVSEERRRFLRGIPDFDRVGAGFISHDVNDLASDRVAELKSRGIPVLCWTVRSESQESEARKVADNITFEGYTAVIPPP